MTRATFAAFTLLSLAACGDAADPTVPAPPAAQLAIVSDNRNTYVLNAVIRAMDNPEICPDPTDGGQAFGQVRLSLARSIDNPDMYEATVTGHLIRGGSGDIDGSIIHGSSAVFNLTVFQRGANESFASVAGSAQLSSALAEVMIEDPDILVARFESTGGPALCGAFGVDDPNI